MTLPPAVAWTMRRLIRGDSIDSELNGTPEPARLMIERLNGVEVDPTLTVQERGEALAIGRRPIWEAIQAELHEADRETLILAITNASEAAASSNEADHTETSDRPRFKLTCATDVIVRPIEWLWLHRVPRGMLTLFAGNPKLGKSFVTIAMAAAISRGRALPGSDPPDEPGSVVLLSAEDDLARTIVPRLKTAGADLSKIHILEAVFLADGSEALPSLRVDIDAIEAAVTSLSHCRLIVIDPVSAYLGEPTTTRMPNSAACCRP